MACVWDRRLKISQTNFYCYFLISKYLKVDNKTRFKFQQICHGLNILAVFVTRA